MDIRTVPAVFIAVTLQDIGRIFGDIGKAPENLLYKHFREVIGDELE